MIAKKATTGTQTDKVLVMGEALVDLVIEWGKKEIDAEPVPGGSPANVALALSRLGVPTELVTYLGKDAYGKQITKHLAASGVTIIPGDPDVEETSRAIAWLDEDGAATYSFDIVWEPKSPIMVDPGVAIVHTGSIASALEPGAQAVLDALRRAKYQALVTYDPNVRPQILNDRAVAAEMIEEAVAAADVVKVSDEDLEWLYPDVSPAKAAQRWLQDFELSLVVMTRGKDGPVAWTRSGIDVSYAPGEVTVVDTVGAGDTFMGGLIEALWRRGYRGPEGSERLNKIDRTELADILEEASEVANVVVQRRGANPPWTHELDR